MSCCMYPDVRRVRANGGTLVVYECQNCGAIRSYPDGPIHHRGFECRTTVQRKATAIGSGELMRNTGAAGTEYSGTRKEVEKRWL